MTWSDCEEDKPTVSIKLTCSANSETLQNRQPVLRSYKAARSNRNTALKWRDSRQAGTWGQVPSRVAKMTTQNFSIYLPTSSQLHKRYLRLSIQRNFNFALPLRIHSSTCHDNDVFPYLAVYRSLNKTKHSPSFVSMKLNKLIYCTVVEQNEERKTTSSEAELTIMTG